ncbi:MAG: hypothetical protein NVSMB26_19280 [Beijerinckiaceae bacterium]
MLELIALILSLAGAPKPALGPLPTLPTLPWGVAAASFRPAERAVDNWRMSAALDLDLPGPSAVSFLIGGGPANLPRCIRLNNYWCIKKAGWAGEIAADAEGHVAFASAQEGAVVAVVLLRRYYLDYGRKSARAILSHWAPAQCGTAVAATGPRRRSALGPRPVQTASLSGLATRGIGGTLRARWLAAHGRGGVALAAKGRGKRVALRRSVVPDHLGAMMRAPTIAVGMGEPAIPVRLEPLRLASLAMPALANPFLAPSRPAASCVGDSARLANYAAHAIAGVTESADADLKLFDTDGMPQPALPRFLANMAAVEIGPFAADGKLIDAAIETVRNTPRPVEKTAGRS